MNQFRIMQRPDQKKYAFLAVVVFLVAAAGPAAGTGGTDVGIPGDLAEAIESGARSARLTTEENARFREDIRAALQGGADAGILADIFSSCTAAGSDGSEFLAVAGRARRLADLELPVDPVLDRYLQGMAKGVPFGRICSVADRLEERLAESARIMEERFTGFRDRGTRRERLEMIDQGAYALGAGVPGDHLGRAAGLVNGTDGTLRAARAPVLAIGCLASGGIGPDRSFEVIETAWKHGYRGGDLERIGRDLGAFAHTNGDAADGAVNEMLSRIRSREEMGQIAGFLDRLRSESGHGAAGMGAMEETGHMHGPGGRPEDPGMQGPQGHGGSESGGSRGGGGHH